MKISTKWMVMLVLVGMVACDESAVDKADNDEILYKETVQIYDIPKATLTFFDVQDSRCPANVQCIWAGNATVDLELNGISVEGRVTKHIVMCLGACGLPRKKSGFIEIDTLTTTFADQPYRFILKKVNAHPVVDSTKLKSNYAIELKVEALE